jgi:cyclase
MTRRLVMVGCGLLAGTVALAAQRTAPAAAEVHALHVQGNVWMLHSAVSNAAVQVGEDGVLVVDTMSAPLADAMIAEIRRLAPGKPIRWIVNTHADPDHTGGNLPVAEAGESIIAGNFAGQAGPAQADYAQIIAHEQVLTRMLQMDPPPPVFAQPSETFFVPKFELFYNGEPIEILHIPHAHCDGDVLVFFRKSDVVVAGDLFVTTTFPVIRLQQGGSLAGILAGLNRIIDITVPKEKQEGGTYVIPGHGRLTDEADVVDYRDMVTIIRDRVADAIDRGLTFEQIRAARLLRDYEGRWGATEGPWTTDAFLEAVYRSLQGTARPGGKGQ